MTKQGLASCPLHLRNNRKMMTAMILMSPIVVRKSKASGHLDLLLYLLFYYLLHPTTIHSCTAYNLLPCHSILAILPRILHGDLFQSMKKKKYAVRQNTLVSICLHVVITRKSWVGYYRHQTEGTTEGAKLALQFARLPAQLFSKVLSQGETTRCTHYSKSKHHCCLTRGTPK